MKEIHYVTLCRCVTGANSYRAFQDNRLLGTAEALVLPQFPVYLSCGEMKLQRENSPGDDSVIFRDTGEEFARIQKTGRCEYQLCTPWGDFSVIYQEGAYVFGREDVAMAAMSQVQKGSPFYLSGNYPREPEWEPHFALISKETLPDELAMVLLHFPLLLPCERKDV